MQEQQFKPQQKFFKGKLLFIFLALISAFAPISTDVYLPSMPSMAQYFSASEAAVNLTLSMFFIFYSVGMLIWGPLSDKYGRKPILLIGLGMYTVASLLCIFSVTIDHLIIGRIFQALGGSSSVIVASAIIKDSYSSKERESALATVQSIAMLAPMVAPMLGAVIVKFFSSWQVVFIILTIAGALALLGSLLLSETHSGNSEVSLASSFWDLKVALCKFNLFSLLLIFSLPLIPFLSYVVTASTIYMSFFHLDATQFSLFFAANAACTIASPFLYIKILRKFFQVKNLVTSIFIIMIISGILMYYFGTSSAYAFLLCLLPATISGSVLRAPAANLMLSQHDNAGTTASLMGFAAMFLGGMGTLLVSFSNGNIIEFIGILLVVIGFLATVCWLWVYEKILA